MSEPAACSFPSPTCVGISTDGRHVLRLGDGHRRTPASADGAGRRHASSSPRWQPSRTGRAAGADVEVDLVGRAARRHEDGGVARQAGVIPRAAPRDAAGRPGAPSRATAGPKSLKGQSFAGRAAAMPRRSDAAEWFVAVGICTHLGCLRHRSDGRQPQTRRVGADWHGWLLLPLPRLQSFDLAGCVPSDKAGPHQPSRSTRTVGWARLRLLIRSSELRPGGWPIVEPVRAPGAGPGLGPRRRRPSAPMARARRRGRAGAATIPAVTYPHARHLLLDDALRELCCITIVHAASIARIRCRRR